MSRGKELLKKIDEHIQSGKGKFYGLEFSDTDLRFIRKLLEAQEELIDVGILEHKEYCPSCGKRIRGKYCIGGRVYTPPFCCLCGKPLKPEGGDPPSEE